jgi:hypothetical protein
MVMGTGAWGDGSWGAGSWGGGVGIGFQFLDAIAIRENALRVEFSAAVYFSSLLDPGDASVVTNWSITANHDSVGLNGDNARDVNVILVTQSTVDDGVALSDTARFLILTLDRPFTAWPAQYGVTWSGIFSDDLTVSSSGTFFFNATYRQLEAPQIQVPSPSRDMANPQTLSAAQSSLPQPVGPYVLGAFGVDHSGDYATDEGDVNLKKRILRRLMTRKGAFAHLPNYGVGVPDEVKKLGTAATISRLRADAEAQISQEPDVQQVRVVLVIDSATPDLVRLRVAVKTKLGKPVAFDAAFSRQAA